MRSSWWQHIEAATRPTVKQENAKKTQGRDQPPFSPSRHRTKSKGMRECLTGEQWRRRGARRWDGLVRRRDAARSCSDLVEDGIPEPRRVGQEGKSFSWMFFLIHILDVPRQGPSGHLGRDVDTCRCCHQIYVWCRKGGPNQTQHHSENWQNTF
jgi:hypothetical protein